MALIQIDITSFQTFSSAVLARAEAGLGYDVDGSYGYQCWDLAAELWMNIPEFSFGLYPKTGLNPDYQEVYRMWTETRAINQGMSFDLVWRYEDIKAGDVIVLNASWYFPTTGHVCYAYQDYDPNAEEPEKLLCLGQNQDIEHSSPTVGYKPTVNLLPVRDMFLGAFRYKEWETAPPVRAVKRKPFPWYLVARRLQMMRYGL